MIRMKFQGFNWRHMKLALYWMNIPKKPEQSDRFVMLLIRAAAGKKICCMARAQHGDIAMNIEADRSIVLTGATGFLGAFLMAGLLDRGYRPGSVNV